MNHTVKIVLSEVLEQIALSVKELKQNLKTSQNYASWWFQPLSNILVRMGIFPK